MLGGYPSFTNHTGCIPGENHVRRHWVMTIEIGNPMGNPPFVLTNLYHVGCKIPSCIPFTSKSYRFIRFMVGVLHFDHSNAQDRYTKKYQKIALLPHPTMPRKIPLASLALSLLHSPSLCGKYYPVFPVGKKPWIEKTWYKWYLAPPRVGSDRCNRKTTYQTTWPATHGESIHGSPATKRRRATSPRPRWSEQKPTTSAGKCWELSAGFLECLVPRQWDLLGLLPEIWGKNM